MTGLVGFTRPLAGNSDPRALLGTMQDALAHFDHNRKDALWTDEAVYVTRVYNNPSNDPAKSGQQPVECSGVYVWMEGLFYNRDEVAAQYQIPSPPTDAELIAILYKHSGHFDFLRPIDGLYAAAIYDSTRQQIHLTTDRFGIRRLHWARHNGGFWWGSEVKLILSAPGYSPVINRQTAKMFSYTGSPFLENTWLEGVHRLEIGSVVTWDLRAAEVSKRHYWWWDAIRLRAEPISVEDAAEELGRLTLAAVARRCPNDQNNPRANVELSGGLDSRGLLAAIPPNKEVHTYTSGQKNCLDIQLAAQVSRVRGATHHVYEISGATWINPVTLYDVWRMDGESGFAQVVGSRAHGRYLAEAPDRLNGMGGGLIPGGIKLTRDTLDLPITQATMGRILSGYKGFDEDVSKYADLRKMEFYVHDNRSRRYQGGAIHTARTHGEIHVPYMDNQLVEFVLSLPDSLRLDRYLYRVMLLRFFPAYYESIPWQYTGVPVNFPTPLERLRRLPQKARRVFFQYTRKWGWTQYKRNDPRYTILDTMRWLREEPTRSFAEHVLFNPQAIYPNYVSREETLDMWQRHQRGENFNRRLVYRMSAEVWFQQLFEGKFRERSAEVLGQFT